MSETENAFFDELDIHLKTLQLDQTEVNKKSYEIIYCLMKLAIGLERKTQEK